VQDQIQKAVSNYFTRSQEPNHRFKSWEHCFRFFSSRDVTNKDIACLHLAFYLASWGMLRGSSQLLQRDYKVHKDAVELILDSEFDDLLAFSMSDAQNKAGKLFDLINRLRRVYHRLLAMHEGSIVSDMLVTKVLLGTLGCTPAYDTLFIRGLRQDGLTYSGLKLSNYQSLIKFYEQYEEAFVLAQDAVNQNSVKEGLTYPIMKIIDMYFWVRGDLYNQPHAV
jgi:hypothetical protein